jgi:hypothetical protein
VLSRRFAIGAAVVALTLGVVGCGSNEDGVDAGGGENTDQLQLMSARQVADAPAGSPQRAIFSWWRFLQYRNARDSLALFVPEARSGLTDIGYAALLFRDFGPWAERVRPLVRSVDRSGDHAVAYVTLVIKDPIGPELVRTSHDYVALSLDRRGGRWLISDPSFFAQQSSVLRDLRLKREREQERQSR